ncbi:hypothetical protein [Sulfurospirillum sp. hDNRA2]|uniref:hypothetical protein n=1 Tax=Sulfurospirillum sp. hDNRA2 TaxID=3237298 RepID=UPI0020B76FA0|nr:hypothetical protein [Sulfurospirillum sp. DNRA8]MCP3651888.1 hypothetical protein [Sulfurospirillum sp. DNRA8]MCR1810735.1 hypothetical protein [Sulfurospirillum sp. DNRA8]
MILYDKNGLFLGMGNQELYLLGYEDIEEFRNYHNDFADLFINKPGFIFKFKNFSWIDYALHSGTPNKRVLIKTKNGKELDTSLNINEIFLSKEINGCSTFFSVELTNAPLYSEAPASFANLSSAATSSLDAKELPKDIPNETSFNSSSFLYDYTPTSPASDTQSLTVPFLSEPVLEESVSLDASNVEHSYPLKEEVQESFDFKLKFDHTVLDTPPSADTTSPQNLLAEEYRSIDQIAQDDFHFTETPASQNVEDTSIFNRVETVDETALDEPIAFDLCDCAEELGLDISTLAQIIEEYIENLDTAMPILYRAVHDNNRILAKNESLKLKSVALHLHVVPLYYALEHLETGLDFDTKEELLQTLQTLQDTIEIFKETVL